MKIELNEQEVDTLKLILEVERENKMNSAFYNTVVGNILNKLSESVEQTTYPDSFISETEQEVLSDQDLENNEKN